MQKETVYESKEIEIIFSIKGTKGILSFLHKFESENNTEILFNLFESFESNYEEYNCSFGMLSGYEKDELLKKSGYSLVHLIHYDAYVIIPKDKKNITISVPENKIQHVVGSRGSNVNSLCSRYEYNQINVIKNQRRKKW